MKKIQDLGKKLKTIQEYPRSWQENQDAKHWEALKIFFFSEKENHRLTTFEPLTSFEAAQSLAQLTLLDKFAFFKLPKTF